MGRSRAKVNGCDLEPYFRPLALSLYQTIITPNQSLYRNVLPTTVCSTNQVLCRSSIMASMGNKSKGKLAQRFTSLDGLEEYEKDDIQINLNKVLTAMEVVEAKKAKNRPRPSPPVPSNRTRPSLGLEARRLVRKLYIRVQDGLEDDKVMAASTYADELLGMAKELCNEIGIDAVQPDEVWEPSDTESNDGQGNYHPRFHHFGFLVANSIRRPTTTTTGGTYSVLGANIGRSSCG
jgi:hypothetical protein